MREKIKKYVHESLKNYGVGDRKLEKELTDACFDEYSMQIENGADAETAFEFAVENIDDIAKSKVTPKNKYKFAFCISIAAFLVACLEVLGSIMGDPKGFYSIVMPVALVATVIVAIIYLIVKRHSYRWFDFVILGIVFISWSVAIYQLLPAFLFNYTPGSSDKLEFIFPCIFKYSVHRDWMAEGEFATSVRFYPDFLVSFASVVTTLVLYIRQNVITVRVLPKEQR